MDSTVEKPAIVIVPGGWHPCSTMLPLITRLEAANYEVCPVDYPSIAANPTNTTIAPDIAKIQAAVVKLADRGKDVVMVMHSMGGIMGCEAAHGLLKSDRARADKPGGIVRLVFLCAFALPEHASLWGATGGPTDWYTVEDGAVRLLPDVPRQIFYHRCPADVAEQAAAQLLPTARVAFRSEVTYAAWKHAPCTYLVCESDRAIPLAYQEHMIGQEGARFDVVRCDTDHSPFLSLPDFTAEVVRKAAGESI